MSRCLNLKKKGNLNSFWIYCISASCDWQILSLQTGLSCFLTSFLVLVLDFIFSLPPMVLYVFSLWFFMAPPALTNFYLHPFHVYLFPTTFIISHFLSSFLPSLPFPSSQSSFFHLRFSTTILVHVLHTSSTTTSQTTSLILLYFLPISQSTFLFPLFFLPTSQATSLITGPSSDIAVRMEAAWSAHVFPFTLQVFTFQAVSGASPCTTPPLHTPPEVPGFLLPPERVIITQPTPVVENAEENEKQEQADNAPGGSFSFRLNPRHEVMCMTFAFIKSVWLSNVRNLICLQNESVSYRLHMDLRFFFAYH